jgi:hypothetical protein
MCPSHQFVQISLPDYAVVARTSMFVVAASSVLSIYYANIWLSEMVVKNIKWSAGKRHVVVVYLSQG